METTMTLMDNANKLFDNKNHEAGIWKNINYRVTHYAAPQSIGYNKGRITHITFRDKDTNNILYRYQNGKEEYYENKRHNANHVKETLLRVLKRYNY